MKLGIAWIFALLLLPLSATAVEEGFEYQAISPPVPLTQGESNGKIEVIEMFFYGCPHCFRAEPMVNKWLKSKPDFVNFTRMPAIFRDSWEPLARAFYTAQALGVLDRIHEPLFNSIHIKQQKNFTKEAIRAFFISQGVSAADFDKTYNSFQVANQVARAKDLGKRFKIQGVPAFVVDGKWRTNGTMAGGLENIPEVLNTLIRKQSAAQASN
jgi:thiol:disulfide interchange protein DsbA